MDDKAQEVCAFAGLVSGGTATAALLSAARLRYPDLTQEAVEMGLLKRGVITGLVVVFTISCGVDEGEEPLVCEPGETEECLCGPASSGIQICNEDGAAWGECKSCFGGCQPDCHGKSCGNDGCGGSCGYCASSQSCSPSGQCISPFEDVYQNCIDGGWFLDLCIENPPSFSCIAACDYFTDMCGYTGCKDSVSWWQNCQADPQTPKTASGCHDLNCALYAAQYVGDYSGCPD